MDATDAPAPIDALLAALASDGRLSVPTKVLARAAGLDADGLESVLSEGVGTGLVAAWTDPRGRRCACLSPAVAGRLGLVADPTGRRWVPRGTRIPNRPPRRSGWSARVACESDLYGAGGPGLDGFASDRPGPPDLLIKAESAPAPAPARKGKKRPGRPPRPVLLGLGFPWTATPTPGPCPGCAGRELPPGFHCLYCDNPLPEAVAKSRAAGRRRAEADARRAGKAGLRGGKGRGAA